MNSRNNGILRLKHLRETSEARAEDMREQAQRFERLKNSETRAVSSFNLFQTPPELAARVAGLIPVRGRILEPSAGLGRLYKAARAVNDIDPITLVELSPDCAGELYRETAADSYAKIIQADFLDCDASRLGGLFDAVLMNPPFCRGTDVKHVKHAIDLLAPGGWLVSVVANGPRQCRDLQPLAADWIQLPPRSFAGELTNVETAIFVYHKAD